jgi:AcrR family transcriptional regulator
MARLEKTDWLDFALAELAEKGHETLKAQTLAAGLGVTRGSFYWHFEDLEAFKRDLIGHWTDRTTQELVRRGARGGGGGTVDRHDVAGLPLRRGHGTRGAGLGGFGRPRGELVAAVDWRRVRFAEQLLESLWGAARGGRASRAHALLGCDRPPDDGAPLGAGAVGCGDRETWLRSCEAAQTAHIQMCIHPCSGEWSLTAPPRPPSPTTGSSGSGQGRSGERRMMMSPFGSRSGIS